MTKRGIVFLLAFVFLLSLFSIVIAQDANESPEDIGPPPEVDDSNDPCEDVECEDGFECSNGECFPLFEGDPAEDPIDDDDSEDSGKKICCGFFGPADRPEYEWRKSRECQSPPGAEFGDQIVDDSFCKEDNKKSDKKCLPCGDECLPYDTVISAYCLPPTNEEPNCGVENGECIVLGFEDDSEGEKSKVCHFPPGNKDNPNTLEVGDSSLNSHLSHGDYFGECEEYEEIDIDKEIGDGGSINGIDRFFDGIFKNDIENLEERFAEIRTLIKEGKTEEAIEQLQHFKKFAERLETEVSPEDKDKAVRLSKIVRKSIRELEEELSEEDKIKFKKELQKKAHNIGKAAEIASKIQELCTSLSEIDPDEYGRICKTDEDAPEWQKKLDKDLTEDQKREARKFGEIMEQCFTTSGQNCRCEEIPYDDFADACLEAAPLAKACEIDGDEEACDKLDRLDMPRLPDHLEDVFDVIDDGSSARFDNHMPPECREAGVTTRNDCAKIMVTTNAPPECKDAMLKAAEEGEVDRRVFERICDDIMMNIHSPECAEKGITKPEECARYMDSFRRDDHRGPRGPMINLDCREIKDPDDRLECFDKASSHTKSFKGFDDENYDGPCMTKSDWRAKKQECKSKFGEHAGDEPIMGDSGDGYECAIDAKCKNFGQYKEGSGASCGDCQRECEPREGQRLTRTDCINNQCECYYEDDDHFEEFPDDSNRGPGCYDCSSQCPAGANTDCVNDRCVCGDVPDSGPQYGEGEGPGEPADYEGEPPSSDSTNPTNSVSSPDSPDTSSTDSNPGGGSSTSSSSDSSSSDSGSGDSSNSYESDNSVSDPGITGNAFLDYYY